MVTNERPAVLVDVAMRRGVDAAFFLAMSAGFLIWGVVDRNPVRNILSWAIMATVALLVDRMRPFLRETTQPTGEHDPPPTSAVHRTIGGYATWAAGAVAAVAAVDAAFAVYLVPPGFFAGWLTAAFVIQLRSLFAAREIERTLGVRLSMRLQRNTWRTRPPVFYATPRPAA